MRPDSNFLHLWSRVIRVVGHAGIHCVDHYQNQRTFAQVFELTAIIPNFLPNLLIAISWVLLLRG
jgi:hypothetical protein